MRLSVAGLALIVACTAVPAPETTTSTEAPATTAAPTTTTSTVTPTTTSMVAPVPDPNFTLRVSTGCMPLFDLIIAELSIVECPEWGMPLQPSLYRLVPPTATLVPLLAADPTPPLGQATDDGWEIIVNLRTGVTWSDGSVVDAADVVYTYQILSDQAPWRFSYTVEAIDDFTVRYVWEERPTTDIWQFDVALAPIFSADFWGAQQARPEGGFGFTPNLNPTAIPTTGPYRIAEVDDTFEGWTLEAVPDWWEAGSTFTVWRNGAVRYVNPNLGLDETYGTPDGEVVAEWTTGPYASRVEYSVLNYQDELAAFQSGEIDLMLRSVDSPSGIPDLGPAAGLVRSILGVDVVVFDFDAPPFNDVTVRRAAACAFDPGFLVEEVQPGKVLAATGWGVGLGPWWEETTLDCEGVATGNILEGVPVAGVLVRPPEYSPISAAVAAAVYDWLAGLGAEPIDGFLALGEDTSDQPDLTKFNVYGLGLDPIRLIASPRVLIDTDIGWQPPEAVALLEQIRSAYDLETDQAAHRELQRLVADQVPAVPVLRRTMVEAFNTSITPPFLTQTDDGYTTPLIGGLQAWEPWIIPATRPAG